MQHAKTLRLAKEAKLVNEKLDQEVKQSESQIKELNEKQSTARDHIASLERQESELQQSMKAEKEHKEKLLKEQIYLAD